MILRSWLVSADGDSFIARKHVQGHDGMRQIKPHFDGDIISASTLEGVREVLRLKNCEQVITEKSVAAFQTSYPGTLEIWW